MDPGFYVADGPEDYLHTYVIWILSTMDPKTTARHRGIEVWEFDALGSKLWWDLRDMPRECPFG